MQFNSFLFIMAFLPLFTIIYFLGNKVNTKFGRLFLIFAGLFFYYFAGIYSFTVFLISAFANYAFAFVLKKTSKASKLILFLTVASNIGLLLYYKYAGFIISDVIMPLGISFFTFQQIMYVVGVYNGEIESVNILDYAAYITYFPKLIMGPLVEPKNLLSQINNPELKKVNIDNIAVGLKLFSFGLFKKLVLADTFSRAVEWGFVHVNAATSTDMILTMLFYTFEIYFDFSGYIDMATGISKIINIELPINFDSPYKAVSIRDFWKRWHISLTYFFTKYIYFPLGGSKKGKARTYLNIMIVFLVSGLWHGSNFTFILWGAMHGILQVLERIFKNGFIKIPQTIKWIYTFVAVNVLWLLFRAESINQWCTLLYKAFSSRVFSISKGMYYSFLLPETPFLFRLFHLTMDDEYMGMISLIIFTVSALFICLVPENNHKTQEKRSIFNMIIAAVAFVWGFLCLGSESVFVYFNF